MTAILRHRITPAEFVKKWRPVTLTERAAAQEHFIDLCRLFDHPTPVEDDPTGERFTFEKGVQKSSGRDGFADVWKRGFFAWEYKKRKRSLVDALDQLSRYALALESPPLQIACDTESFRVVTAKTNTVPRAYDLTLNELLDSDKRRIIELAFYDPKKLQPGEQRADLTKNAADKFSTLVQSLQAKGHSLDDIGHFVNRLVFLFFMEDVGYITEGFFRRTISKLAERPRAAQRLLTELFKTLMTGGLFGLEELPWINGGLFDDREALPLDEHDIGLLKAASSQDWGHIDPTIFGTLFERFLDPVKRSQIGAHYTDTDKIRQIIEPVVLRPLREEWTAAKNEIEFLVRRASTKGSKSKDWTKAEDRQTAFLERLRTLSILDPACGSGNFLYLVLHGVKNIEHAANQECEALGLPFRMPIVGPEILRGIEINPLAAELARTTVWIGDIQWAIQNGIRSRPEPILRKLDAISCRNALLSDGPAPPSVGAAGVPVRIEAEWPYADFIVGNPPFLGGKLLRRQLGDVEVDDLFRVYGAQVPPEADLVTYWFEKARAQIAAKKASKAGLVSTNSIRNGASQKVLERVMQDAAIFEAWSDEPWVVDGANVRVSLVCFSVKEARNSVLLNNLPVSNINSDLTGGLTDLTRAVPLAENSGVSYQGITKGGQFQISADDARKWLKKPKNANGKKNAEVLFPMFSGGDIVKGAPMDWVVNFTGLTERDASFFEKPFEHVLREVKPFRDKNKRQLYRDRWWLFAETRPGMISAMKALNRYIVTPKVSKHRVFVFAHKKTMPDNLVIAIARSDYTCFGVLSSRFHEAWALAKGATLEDRPTYTPTATFQTYPFPAGLTPAVSAEQYEKDERAQHIAKMAVELDRLRNNWLYPDDAIRFEAEVVPGYPDRIIPLNAESAIEMQTRTLTNLYNERPAWLADAHRDLDRAVATAYGWPENISTEDALARLLELNRERAAAQGKA